MKTSLVLLVIACGGGISQSQECKDWVACSYKTGITEGSLDPSYGPNGTCWSQGSDQRDACNAACVSGNETYRSNGMAADGGCTFGG